MYRGVKKIMNTHGNFQSVVFLTLHPSLFPILITFHLMGAKKISLMLFIFSCGLLLLLLLLFYNLILMMNFFCLFFILFYIFCYLKKCSSISFLHHSFSCFCLLVINNPPLPYVLNKIEEKNKSKE